VHAVEIGGRSRNRERQAGDGHSHKRSRGIFVESYSNGRGVLSIAPMPSFFSLLALLQTENKEIILEYAPQIVSLNTHARASTCQSWTAMCVFWDHIRVTSESGMHSRALLT